MDNSCGVSCTLKDTGRLCAPCTAFSKHFNTARDMLTPSRWPRCRYNTSHQKRRSGGLFVVQMIWLQRNATT